MSWILTEYQVAWLAYLAAFAIIYWTWSRIVSWLPVRLVRQMFKGLLAVLLLTPVLSQHIDGWLIPAWLHFGYAFVLDQGGEMGRSLFNFAVAAVLMLLVLAMDAAWARYRRR